MRFYIPLLIFLSGCIHTDKRCDQKYHRQSVALQDLACENIALRDLLEHERQQRAEDANRKKTVIEMLMFDNKRLKDSKLDWALVPAAGNYLMERK